MMPFDQRADGDSASQQKQSWWFHLGQLWNRLHGKGRRVEPGPEPASPRCWAPSRGASREHMAARTARRKGHLSLSCLALKTRPRQRSCTEMINTQCPSAIQTNRWKAARAKLGVIKKRHWLRCKCSFCKQNPALQIYLEFFKLLWSKGRERSKWWIHLEFHNKVCKRLPKKLQLTQKKKKKDPHPVEPTWT